MLNLFNKDSRAITSEDRETIIAAVVNSAAELFLITHGTFTIAETGRALKARLAGSAKTVLLVGAWKPFFSEDSDAPQQMEFALSELRRGVRGVWIAMDGRLWDPENTETREVRPGVYKLAELP